MTASATCDGRGAVTDPAVGTGRAGCAGGDQRLPAGAGASRRGGGAFGSGDAGRVAGGLQTCRIRGENVAPRGVFGGGCRQSQTCDFLNNFVGVGDPAGVFLPGCRTKNNGYGNTEKNDESRTETELDFSCTCQTILLSDK